MEEGMFSTEMFAIDDINIHVSRAFNTTEELLAVLCKFTPNLVELPTMSAPGILFISMV